MKERNSELDQLFLEVGTYRDSTDYMELLKFVRRFRKMKPYNAMLLHVQKPGSTFVASASDWWEQFRRKPKPGARPLVILRPFGPVAFVYELSDTEGEPFPPELEAPFQASGDVREEDFGRLVTSLFFSGIRYDEQPFGATFAGAVRLDESYESFTTKSGEKNFCMPFAMVVNENLDLPSKLATIYHELGHVFCGHFGVEKLTFLPQRAGLPKEVEEFEAESVCWLLCERQGIHNPSAAYLQDYLTANNTIPSISLDTVLKAVGEIERLCEGLKAPRKELFEI